MSTLLEMYSTIKSQVTYLIQIGEVHLSSTLG